MSDHNNAIYAREGQFVMINGSPYQMKEDRTLEEIIEAAAKFLELPVENIEVGACLDVAEEIHISHGGSPVGVNSDLIFTTP